MSFPCWKPSSGPPEPPLDEVLIPGNNLQPSLLWLLAVFCLSLQKGRTYTSSVYCNIPEPSIVPGTTWTSNKYLLMSNCMFLTLVTLLGILYFRSWIPPLQFPESGTLIVQVWARLAHLIAGYRCPLAPGWAIVAVLGLHTDQGILVARDLGWGLIQEFLFLQKRGKPLVIQSQGRLGIFLKASISWF